MMAARSHAIGFSGSIVFSPRLEVVEPERPVWVVGERIAHAAGFELPPDALVLPERPDHATVAELASRARERDADAVVGAGDGAVLDAAKLAALHAGHAPELILVPCGGEPWRAFAPFSVVDDGAGGRPTVPDRSFGAACVVVSDELLATVDDRLVAISAVDTGVHAMESLLSARGQPYSDSLAAASLAIVADELSGPIAPRGRARLVVAAGLAVEAFLATNLGMAHAFASPLGTALGITHDTLNGVLGRTAVTFSGDAPALVPLAAALGVPPRMPDILERIDAFLARAELPRTLRELGIGWNDVEQVLPHAARSSGVRGAAEPMPDARLRAFARAAWAGAPTTSEEEEETWTPTR
jgi:alcohol dehydrogenase class IV